MKSDGRRKLNKVGRRYQLARELTQELDWLRGCSVPRIAWVARDVADAGWTVTEVKGWLHMRGEAARVRRGSGLLAMLLSNAVTTLDSPEKRAFAVEQWCGAQEAARRDRIQQVRARAERFEGDWQAPTSRAVQGEVETAFAQVRVVANGGHHQVLGFGADDESVVPGLTEQALKDLVATAHGQLKRGETDLVTGFIGAMGLKAAEHIFGEYLVHRARQLASVARSSFVNIGRW